MFVKGLVNNQTETSFKTDKNAIKVAPPRPTMICRNQLVGAINRHPVHYWSECVMTHSVGYIDLTISYRLVNFFQVQEIQKNLLKF